MEKLLITLLQQLEAIGAEREELYDSEVREAMDRAITDGFLEPQPSYVVPENFGMYSEEGNRLVRAAIFSFLESTDSLHLQRFHERLAALQNHEICTAQVSDFNSFFGWADPEQYDESGKYVGRQTRVRPTE